MPRPGRVIDPTDLDRLPDLKDAMASIQSIKEIRNAVGRPDARQPSSWQHFLDAANHQEFLQSWFSLLCEDLTGAHCGALLMRDAETNSFAPAAIWPRAGQDLSFLSAVAERCLKEQQGVVAPGEGTRATELHVAYPVHHDGEMLAVVTLAIARRSDDEVQTLLRRIHWSLGWLQHSVSTNRTELLEQRVLGIGTLCETIANALRDIPLLQALYEATNHIARYLDGSRVAIGLVKGTRIRVKAFSDAAELEKNTDANSLYKAAMEEALDSLATITFDASTQLGSASAHAELAHAFGAKHIVTTPLLLGSQCVAVVLVETHSSAAFEASQLEWLAALAPMLAGVIEQKEQAERGYWQSLREDAASFARAVVGPNHLTWKLVGLVTFSLLTFLVVADLDYKVRAKTVIEGQVQRTAAAPFQGFLAASYVRPGDIVRRGQVLCALDDRELALERDKATSEREQRLRELREAMAAHDLTRVQIVEAQVRQSEAQLALLNDQLARARVTAPFDGVVISGDLSQVIGTPVELGRKLFEIAPLHDYRVILQVDESEIRHIGERQRGQLMVTGIAGDPLSFSVGKVTPVSTAKDGANYFRVEATLDAASPNLRPGMEGIGRIEVGNRPLWWIALHGFFDWVRLKFWQWSPW